MASTAQIRVISALAAIGLAAGITVACSDDEYRNCPDWECGQGLYYAPIIIPAYGIFGQPGYVASYTVPPSDPRYPKDRPSYVGKPPNFKPPAGAKVNPTNAKPPANYKPPTGSTLTVQKAPKASGNQQPSGGSSSGGSKQTVQKAPSGGSKSSSGSSGGSRSSSGSRK